jgi:hypothetical protein
MRKINILMVGSANTLTFARSNSGTTGTER